MTPETITSLVNLGAAGAVIIVVVIFLRATEKRDKSWQDFFTALNASNKEDVCSLAETMQSLVTSVQKLASDLAAHDQRVDQRIEAAKEAGTQPRRRPQAKP